MISRELFEDARNASWALHRHDMSHNAMERRALALGGGTGSNVPRGSIADRMAPVDSLVDYEAMMNPRVAAWCAAVDIAAVVLYGTDWEHGIAAGLSMSHAEVLDCIYLQRLTLEQTARRVHWSARKVCSLRNEALDHIDQVGIKAAIRGE